MPSSLTNSLAHTGEDACSDLVSRGITLHMCKCIIVTVCLCSPSSFFLSMEKKFKDNSQNYKKIKDKK